VIPATWSTPLPSYLWQVVLHSSVAGFIFYVWARRVDLPSGRTKRRLLAILLVLPMITAAVPGRSSIEFAERVAWLNSARILAVPLPADFRLYHVALLVGVMTVLVTLWQEILPALRRPATTDDPPPDSLVALVRARAGWEHCAVVLSPLDSILVATVVRPRRPRLIVSKGTLAALDAEELDTVIAHEHAHWASGGWLVAHALFAIRLLQCYNPVALWVFREYCVEVEVWCDAVAVSGRDPRGLARVLVRIYQATDRRDLAARGSLRKRVEVLLESGPQDAVLPPVTIAAATAVMLVVLPWIV